MGRYPHPSRESDSWKDLLIQGILFTELTNEESQLYKDHSVEFVKNKRRYSLSDLKLAENVPYAFYSVYNEDNSSCQTVRFDLVRPDGSVQDHIYDDLKHPMDMNVVARGSTSGITKNHFITTDITSTTFSHGLVLELKQLVAFNQQLCRALKSSDCQKMLGCNLLSSSSNWMLLDGVIYWLDNNEDPEKFWILDFGVTTAASMNGNSESIAYYKASHRELVIVDSNVRDRDILKQAHACNRENCFYMMEVLDLQDFPQMLKVERVSKSTEVLVDVEGGVLLVRPSRRLLATMNDLLGDPDKTISQECTLHYFKLKDIKVVDCFCFSDSDVVVILQKGADCAVRWIVDGREEENVQFVNMTAVKVLVNRWIVYILDICGRIAAVDLKKSDTLKDHLVKPSASKAGYLKEEGPFTDIAVFKEGLAYIRKRPEIGYHAGVIVTVDSSKKIEKLKLSEISRLCPLEPLFTGGRSASECLLIFGVEPVKFANFEDHLGTHDFSGNAIENMDYPITVACDLSNLPKIDKCDRFAGSQFDVPFEPATVCPTDDQKKEEIKEGSDEAKDEPLEQPVKKDQEKKEVASDKHHYIKARVHVPFCAIELNLGSILVEYENKCRTADADTDSKSEQTNLYLVMYEPTEWKEWKSKKEFDEAPEAKKGTGQIVLEILFTKKTESMKLPCFSEFKAQISSSINFTPRISEKSKIVLFPDLCSLSPDEWQKVKDHYREYWEPQLSELESKYESYRETIMTILSKRLGNSDRNRMTPRKAFTSKVKFQHQTEFEHHYQDESKWPAMSEMLPVYNGMRLANYNYMHYLTNMPVFQGVAFDADHRSAIGKNLFPCFDRSTRIKVRFENYVEYHVDRFTGLKITSLKRQNMALLNQLVYQIFAVAKKERYYALVFNQIEMYFVGERKLI